jgi:uncharacterized glyoxalase superfamily protein PhnB
MSIAFQQTIPLLRIFDLARAKQFYLDYLGFTLDWEHAFDGVAPRYLQVSRAGLTLHLTEHHGDCCPGATCFVWMNGIEELHRELQAKGYGYLNPGLETAFYGARCLELTDPFGNRLRLNERLAESERSDDR